MYSFKPLSAFFIATYFNKGFVGGRGSGSIPTGVSGKTGIAIQALSI
jgi:hypothetical protein